jgi:hypothetical protein
MKTTFLSALLSAGFLIGQSHAQDTKRIPPSVNACGLDGSIEERIEDCSEQKKGFVLVTRTQEGKEVHKEVSTGLLWSDRLPSRMTHNDAGKACKADLEEVGGISGVTWRLPSDEEYRKAEKNGIREALPNMNYLFWCSLRRDDFGNHRWVFDGRNGFTEYGNGRFDFSVRCVAR